MSLPGRFIRGVLLSGGGMVVALGSGLVALKLITNAPALSEADIGVYAMFVAVTDFFVSLNGFGMRTALPKLIGSADAAGKRSLVNATLTAQSGVSLALGLVIFAVWWLAPVPALLAENDSWNRLYPYLYILPAFLLVFTLRELLLAMQAGLHQYVSRTLGLTGYAVVQVVLVAALVWYAEGALTTLLWVIAAANAAAVLLLLALLRLPLRPVRDLRSWCGGVRFARPLWINNLFGYVFNRMDTLLVGALLGPAAAGIFDIGAKRLPQYAVSVLNASLVPFLPSLAERLARDDRAGATRLMLQVYDMFAFLGYAGLLFTLLVQGPLVRLAFSEAYAAALPVLGWMLAAGLLALQTGIFGQSLVALGRPRPIAVINILLALVSLGLNVLFIPRFGIAGAGYAAVIAIGVSHMLHAGCVHLSGMRFGLWPYLRPHSNLAGALALLFVLRQYGLGAGAPLAALSLFLALAPVTGLLKPNQVRRVLAGLRHG
ncbi:MAG: lipopolysaccharide biosynthesis protein [Candidatus Hydrogenedentota bacterium]